MDYVCNSVVCVIPWFHFLLPERLLPFTFQRPTFAFSLPQPILRLLLTIKTVQRVQVHVLLRRQRGPFRVQLVLFDFGLSPVFPPHSLFQVTDFPGPLSPRFDQILAFFLEQFRT